MLNKKAQIALGLIPIIAIVLAAAALFSLLSFRNTFQDESSEYSIIIQEINERHQYILAQSNLLAIQTLTDCPSCSPSGLKSKYKSLASEKENQFTPPWIGNFYGKIRNGDYSILENKLIIPEVFVESSSGLNKIKRTFTIEINLDIQSGLVDSTN